MAGLTLRNYGWGHKIVFAERFCLDHSNIEQNCARYQLYVWGHRKGFGKSLQRYSAAVMRMLSFLLYSLSHRMVFG